jgi:hypothetical protein
MSFPDTIIDGNFTTPREIEGSPTISLDEITYSMIITRRYAVLKTAYVPLPQKTPDVLYKSAILVTENTDAVEGPMMKFHRIFAEVPPIRFERRQISFTVPGVPAVYYSSITGLPIGWNKYGTSAPISRLLMASVYFSYTIDTPLTVPPLTKITYQGQEVDFAGPVYVPVGDVPIAGNKTEPRFEFQGFTNPALCPGIWTVAAPSRRWRGPIWETELIVITLPY